MSINKLKKENKTFGPRKIASDHGAADDRRSSAGFTLIELLVSMALFSIVIVIILGSIISITDANKKARSLMTVMNNLNFTVDSMTRSFKTGSNPSESSNCFTTDEIDYQNTGGSTSVTTREVRYCFDGSGEVGKITKSVDGNTTDLTSPDIDIQEAYFDITPSSGYQPLLIINLQGEVQVTPTVSSEFTVQTSVSQRRLEI